ncbi:hypothetical protein [Actinoplanes sp. GCM10030250]|uniref:hypothetical protein n=1 Tax=Actinoplanes sp. GCM10030250 TaxID=3273376 RepID=UPI0036146939
MRPLPLATAAVAALTLLTGSIHRPHRDIPEPPTDPGIAVLQVKEWRSLVGPSERAQLPEVTVMGGGRVIVPAGQDGALQRAAEHMLTPDRYRHLYRLAHDAGLARNRFVASPMEATDGSMLVVTLRSGGRTYTTKITNPGGDEGDRFRSALSALIAPATSTPYRPMAYAALVTGGFGTKESQVEAQPWPGGGDLTTGVRTYLGLCTILTSAPPAATETAQWKSGGQTLWVTLRPLLPHESTCTDLDRGTP